MSEVENQEVQAEEVQQPVEPTVVSIQMTLEGLNALLAVLDELPHGKVAGFVRSFRQQAIAQLQANSPVAQEPTEELTE